MVDMGFPILARRLAAVALTSWLVAGGGGGGDREDPPVGPGPVLLAATAEEATQAMAAAAGAADGAASDASALNGLLPLFGDTPLGSVAASRRHALARETESCDFLFDRPCTGRITVESEHDDFGRVIPAGTELIVTFESLGGRLFDMQLWLDGVMTMTFVSAFDTYDDSLRGLHLQVAMAQMQVEVNGQRFGPLNETIEIRVDEHDVRTIATRGRTYRRLDGVVVRGPGRYDVGAVDMRVSYRQAGGDWCELTLTNWRVVGGRAQVGSMARIGGANGWVDVRITASAAARVTAEVTITVDGNSTRWIVTADYPADGGLPVYTAVPA